jgi:hypothetical protein
VARKSRQWLVRCLRALADESCLTILGLLSQRDYELEELAARLNLPVEAISEQVVRLREVGLVNLQMHGTQRSCRINPVVLRDFKEAVVQVDTLPEQPAEDDYRWLDALNLNDFERKVMRSYVVNGRLRTLPERHKTLDVLMRWIATKFQAGIDYAEHEVNALLTEYYEDYVTLRRELINYGFLKRERDGSRYWIVRRDG